MSQWEEFKERLFKENPEARAEYESLRPMYTAIADIIRLRLEKGVTQAELARRLGKQQPAIARLESGKVMPSLASLQEVAEALDATLVVRLEGKDQSERRAS
jgi:transcriptional regulator with XRE-family HTH domain